MEFIILIIASLLQLQAVDSVNTKFPKTACEVYEKDGDYIIGGIFWPYDSDSATCDGKVSQRISFIEAMTYTIETINNRTDLLPGVQLGYEIRNTCSDNEAILAWSVMTMTTSVGQNEYTDTCPDQNRTNSGKVIGIIGPNRSIGSISASNVARTSAVPVVSFFSTSDELSDSDRFPFFFRTVPPDKFQVQVIVDILRYFNWKYIALFYTLDSYGIHGARQIIQLSELYDICIPVNIPVTFPVSESDIDDIAIKLSREDKVNVIIIFSSIGAEGILEGVTRMHNPRRFTFIGSDGWNPNSDLDDYIDVLRGAIFIHFFSERPATFEEYFDELPYNQDKASPWYKKRLSQIATAEKCTNWTSCPIPSIHWNTQQVIRVVEVLAYALNATLQDAGQNLTPHQRVDEWNLRENLLDVSIPLGAVNKFHFDENGEVSGRYVVQNWQFNNGQYDLVEIGKWDSLNEPHLSLTEGSMPQWNTQNAQVPISVCIEDCQPGYIEVPREKKCCWGCQKCDDYAIVVRENTSSRCQDCLVTHWPDDNFTTCVPIKESFLGDQDPVVGMLVTGACLGLILICVAAVGMWNHSEHPIIKASSRELSPINLFGLGLSCITVIVLNSLKPSDVACVICEIGISTSFCVSFAPVLLKVNRIWRIFNLRPRRGSVKPVFTSPKNQLFMVGLIIILQVVLSLISIPFGRSKPDLLFPPQRKPYLGIYCQFSSGFIICCVYNAVILAASSYFAFRARRVPDNFNESKFIAVSVYSTILVCLAAVPVYATADEVSQKVAALSVPLLLNAYLSLVCLYLPKMYAIQFDKEINATRTWKSSTAVSSEAEQTQKSSEVPQVQNI